jgi:muconolactone delta-isomerase
MKFITIGKRNLVPVEPKMAVGLIQAAKEYTKAGLADGSIDVSYMHIDGSGGFVISNADSHEEAMDALLDFPMYVFMDWDVIPVVDMTHAYDSLTKLFQKMGG